MTRRDEAEKEAFLREDFKDSLQWLFVGAIAWKATHSKYFCPHLKVLSMYTGLELSRGLYEFFFAKATRTDDARALEFAPSWDVSDTTAIYKKYMGPRAPMNKRISHLVWGRSGHSGGAQIDESDHLKNQVLNCGSDLLAITKKFIRLVTPDSCRAAAQFALEKALAEAHSTATGYGVVSPFEA